MGFAWAIRDLFVEREDGMGWHGESVKSVGASIAAK